MRPTRLSTLIALFLGAAAVSWGALRVAESRGAVLPPLPWAAPFAIAVVGAAVVVSAVSLRRRLRGAPGTRPPNALGVARLAALGKAGSHAGAVVAGGYAGYAVLLVPTLDVVARRERAVVAVGAVLAAALLVVAGVALERACRLRPPSDESQERDPAGLR
jgi:hypothetical protein